MKVMDGYYKCQTEVERDKIPYTDGHCYMRKLWLFGAASD